MARSHRVKACNDVCIYIYQLAIVIDQKTVVNKATEEIRISCADKHCR